MRPRAALLAAGLLLASATTAAAAAQISDLAPPLPPATQPEANPARASLESALAIFDGQPPSRRLGLRTAAIASRCTNADVVLIAPDASTALAAIARHWRAEQRVPVLIDDGSPDAGADTARFIRAYQPKHVVLIEPATPGDAAPDAAQIERAYAAVFATRQPNEPAPSTTRDIAAAMRQSGFSPHGVVVTDAADPAAVAAVALAAARMQPLLLIDAPQGDISLDTARGLHRIIETELADLGFTLDGLGTGVDAITLAFAASHRVTGGEGQQRITALTDRVGRGDDNQRDAWTGQLTGTAPRALYRAMSALFLQPKHAWVFDGYGEGQPWNTYDGTAAAEELREAGLNTVLHDTPRQSTQDWRNATLKPILRAQDPAPGESGIALINSSGGATRFNLKPGTAHAGDVPALDRPALVHMVHSFSTQRGDNETGIAGRWLRNGAYVYFGSVDEPYLQSFVPTPLVVRRLRAALPAAAAFRLDDAQPWKLQYYGDPLVTIGPVGTRAPVPGIDHTLGTTARDALQQALDGRDLTRAVRMLVYLDRDADAVRLALAAHTARDPDAIAPPDGGATNLALQAAARLGRAEDAITLFGHLPERGQQRLDALDALWTAARQQALQGLTTAQQGLLLTRRRPQQRAADAVLLAGLVESTAGTNAAITVLRRALATDTKPGEEPNEALAKALERLKRETAPAQNR